MSSLPLPTKIFFRSPHVRAFEADVETLRQMVCETVAAAAQQQRRHRRRHDGGRAVAATSGWAAGPTTALTLAATGTWAWHGARWYPSHGRPPSTQRPTGAGRATSEPLRPLTTRFPTASARVGVRSRRRAPYS